VRAALAVARQPHGDYVPAIQTISTVAEAVEYWLENRHGEVRSSTYKSYRQACAYIVGPLLIGTPMERQYFARRGTKRPNAELIEMLGSTNIQDLTTSQIRAWHKILTTQVGNHTANVAKKFLRAALSLAAEDFQLPMPPMPTRLGRGQAKSKKLILTPEQVGVLLNAAISDKRHGIYYAFPFLTGVRPSEQLALLWQDIDLQKGIINIRRTQEPNGKVIELTKTLASVREIPVSPLLRIMLSEWRAICPEGRPNDCRVFPCLGRAAFKTDKKRGRPLLYTNFINTYWRPAFLTLGLPIVTPHSARHAFISTLQAKGIEVGLVAKLAGHADPAITLSVYTQAVRGGEDAIQQLERAYRRDPPTTGDAI
jgi:integrase